MAMAATEDDVDADRRALFTQILARLQELPNYTWDTELAPFHSVCCPAVACTGIRS